MRPSHLIILIIVLIVIFGAAKLPQIAKSVGQSAKVLKKEMRELQDDVPPEDESAPSTSSRTHAERGEISPAPTTPAASKDSAVHSASAQEGDTPK
ncbi:MAG: twin-arginine translocase TatA/TatE family subunit [Actinomycetaceae bacterium]|nr:twin-arginine translocase TatA/TatE family subunit [Arcanobacterium sp.]MDD7687048.1 twin-arginine translocase TatA/TatE family subunit [Actinomycetaceae bacterium]MDY5273295.1 twin-arginine translocase TatA/TatE family subunit [Arcanobacterium sp.]